jgi:site-specific DNA recombinase
LNRQGGETPEDELLLQVQGIVAEYERAKILERSRRGTLHAARRGSVSVLGGAPYGYLYISKKVSADGEAHYEIIFEEARVVQRIFEWIGKERTTLSEICRRLESSGMKTRTGMTKWQTKTIWDMLKNPAYMGQAGFGKNKIGPRRTELRRASRRHPEARREYSTYKTAPEEWIRIPVPGIVTPALFDAAQSQLEENRVRQRQRREGAKHLLQGLIGCSLCHHALYARTTWDKGSRGTRTMYTYYRCPGADSRSLDTRAGAVRCYNKGLRADLVEKAVWEKVVHLLRNPGNLKKEYNRRLSSSPDDATTLKGEQTRLTNAIARMIDSYADGLIEKREFEPRIKRMKAKLSQVESQLAKASEYAESDRQLRLLIVQLEDFSSRVVSNLGSIDWDRKRNVIRALVKCIYVNRDSVNVTFRIGDFRTPQTEAG